MNAIASIDVARERITLGRIAQRGFPLSMAVGGAGLGMALWLGWTRGDNLRYFYHAYLTAYCFYLSISLGALFFVALQHATRAGWSVTVRRISELLAANTAYLAVLFLPILVPVLRGSTSLYPWTDPSVVAGSELLQHKQPYLNTTFFGIRAVFYFAVWIWTARFFLDRSLAQDRTGDPTLTERMERLSPVILLLYAGTVTFASFDWLMSLSPDWFSTIFGVYYYSGAVVGALAAIVLAALLLQSTGRLNDWITTEHYHDLGKLLFSFVIFWGYIAFSQYMLIWYANIPEETTWYLTRQTGTWTLVSLVLLFGGLLVPFFGLLPRWVKRSKVPLAFWAVWLLVVHYIDIYWLVMPNFTPDAAYFGPVDAGCLLGLGGLYLAGLVRVAADRPLVPSRDPRLGESLAFENV